MKKRIFILTFVFVLLLAYVAYAEETADSRDVAETATETAEDSGGLLTEEELFALEELYGADQEAVIEAMNFSVEDAGMEDELSLMPSEKRIIAEQEFAQRFDFYIAEPGGLYSVSYNAALDAGTEDVYEAIRSLYEDAVGLYGEPDTYEGFSSQISANLETIEADGIQNSYSEDWLVGGQTAFHMEAAPLDGDGLTLITLAYQLYVDVNAE